MLVTFTVFVMQVTFCTGGKIRLAQDRFADKPHITEVVILRADIERHIHVRADGLSFINDFRSARGQRRPTDVIPTSPPRYPGGSPIEISLPETQTQP